MQEVKLPKLKKINNTEQHIKYRVGDVLNGHEVLPREQRKKILIISDDIRFFSGIATQSKMLVLSTCHQYNWINIGASIKPPDAGKILDASDDLVKQSGVEDAWLRIYPNQGYGDQNLLRTIIATEKPEAIFFITDPRYYIWLFKMEGELHEMGIPLIYYNIWDELPVPMWNKPYYQSCDLLFGISKQTVQINKSVLRHDGHVRIEDDRIYEVGSNGETTDIDIIDSNKTVVEYLPHGLDPNKFRPISEGDVDYDEYQKFREDFTSRVDIDLEDEDSMVIFWNSRNIRRKRPADLIIAYKKFMDELDIDNKSNICLILHTDPVDPNGTDLPAVVSALCPDYKVVFSDRKIDDKVLNFYYNLADVVPLVSSAEGFGLTSCEGLMAGTPITVTVTGGLQDQCGFKKEDGSYINVNDLSDEWMSNHTGKYKDHGEWVIPLFPKVRSLVGSPQTPYIFDSHCDWEQISEVLKEYFYMGDAERKRRGLLGREYLIEEGFTNYDVSNLMMSKVNKFMDVWKKPEPWTLSLTDSEDKTSVGLIYSGE